MSNKTFTDIRRLRSFIILGPGMTAKTLDPVYKYS